MGLTQILHRCCRADEIAAEKKIDRQLCYGALTGWAVNGCRKMAVRGRGRPRGEHILTVIFGVNNAAYP
jgi:hypothetical protein